MHYNSFKVFNRYNYVEFLLDDEIIEVLGVYRY